MVHPRRSGNVLTLLEIAKSMADQNWILSLPVSWSLPVSPLLPSPELHRVYRGPSLPSQTVPPPMSLLPEAASCLGELDIKSQVSLCED